MFKFFSSSFFPFSNKFVAFFLLCLFILSFFSPAGSFPVSSASSSSLALFDHSSLVSNSSLPLSYNLSVSFSTFFGGNASDYAESIALGPTGNIYITGYTFSSNFPTKHAFNSTYGGEEDAFVAEFDPSGNLVFSTFLGGSSLDYGYAISVDSFGNCYITGGTSSSDFPTKNAFQAHYGGGSENAFVAKFNSTGNLVFSTFFGGNFSDEGYDIAVDNSNTVFVSGVTYSSDFPITNSTNHSLQGHSDAFIAKFDTNGTLLFSSYIGGSGDDLASGIAIDPSGNYYITGSTSSSDFPTKYSYNTSFVGKNENAFIMKFNSSGYLVFSSLFGGSGDDGAYSISLDSYGDAFITGQTTSSNFPLMHAFNSTPDVLSGKGFVSEFSPNGSLLFSSLFDTGVGSGITVDSSGFCYITGLGDFISKLNSTTKLDINIPFSLQYLGGSGSGIAVDYNSNIYITGSTQSLNFLLKNAYNSTYGGYYDAFLIKFALFPVFSKKNDTFSSSTPSFFDFILNSLNSPDYVIFILFFSFLGIIFIFISYTLVEYRKYNTCRVNNYKKTKISFKNFLKLKFSRKEGIERSSQLSDETFELLNEIEKEINSDE